MPFSTSLQDLLATYECSAKELAEASGISASSISRYLSGERLPTSDSDIPQRLAEGLVAVACNRGRLDACQEEAVSELAHDLTSKLTSALTGIDVSYDDFADNFRVLMDVLNISGNRLAHALGFDPSYISRIQHGQRRPANLPQFIDGVSNYVARNYNDPGSIALLADLMEEPAQNLAQPTVLACALRRYMGSSAGSPQAGLVDSFLETLDAFDLNDFLRRIHFDEMKIPTAPFQLPTTRTYEGIEEMKEAELDFLKAAVLSKSTDDVILYSDMPLSEMAEDDEFTKKVMMGMALLIRKGVHLHNIHDVHRPLSELFMGLEGWIPVYMTGQISPYYLQYPTNTAFLHFIRSAGTVAVSGEAIAGNQGGGRYTVTKNAADVAYVRRRAEELLAHAKPLMEIYRENDFSRLDAALARLKRKASSEPKAVGENTFNNMAITVWPKSHALIEKTNAPKVSLLIEYPALVDALERYEPTLF